VLLLAAIVAFVGAHLLERAVQESKLATRSFYLGVALNLAEGAIEQGLFALNSGGFTAANGWTLASGSTTDYVKTLTSGLTLPQGSAGVYVRVDSAYGSSPVVYGVGVVNLPNQPRITKQLRVGASRRRPWSNGMVAKNHVTFSIASTVDSYDSTVGAYNAVTNRTDRATIATNSALPAEITLTGASSIYGYVATGGSDPVVALGRIYGATSPGVPAAPAAYVDPARVRKDFNTNLPDIAAPTGSAYSLGAYSATLTTKTLPRAGDTPGPNGRYLYTASSLSVSLGTLNITGPVDLIVTGNTSILLGGKVVVGPSGSTDPSFNLYTPGDINIALLTDGIVNSTGAAHKATIWGTAPEGSSQTVNLLGAAAMTGTIYLPNGTVNMAIAADVYGAIIAKEILVSVLGRFHWDSELANIEVAGFGYAVRSWVELTATPGSGAPFARDNREPFASLF
jgi:hypothetical protein